MDRKFLCSTFHQAQLFIIRWLGFCKGSSLRRLLGSPIRQSWLGIKVLSRDSVLIFWRAVILQSTSKYDKVLQDHSCNCVSVCYIYILVCVVYCLKAFDPLHCLPQFDGPVSSTGAATAFTKRAKAWRPWRELSCAWFRFRGFGARKPRHKELCQNVSSHSRACCHVATWRWL